MHFSSPPYAIQDTPESSTLISSPSYLMRSKNYEAPRAYNFLNIPWHPLTQIRNIPLNTLSRWVTFRCLSNSSSLGYGETQHTLYLRISHAGQRPVSLTEQRSITDADGTELADRPFEMLSANSAKQINENYPLPQKSRGQTRCKHIKSATIASLKETKVTTSLRTSLKVDYAVYSTHCSAELTSLLPSITTANYALVFFDTAGAQ